MKIRPIKSILEVKSVYKFIIDSFKNELTKYDIEKFPMIDTYNHMIENFEKNQEFQLIAEDTGVFEGCIVAVEKNEKEAEIRAIVVKKNFQKKGIAKKLLKAIERILKSKKIKIVKILERDNSNGFYLRSGYIPNLYISTKNKEFVDEIREAANQVFGVVEEYIEGKTYIFKVDVNGEPAIAYKRLFTSISQSIKCEYIYEKKLR